MTLNVNQPTDQELNANWPYWIRALAVEINSIIFGEAGITTTELAIAAATTSLSVGTGEDLSTVSLEKVIISSAGPSPITQITGGLQGQVKIFIFQDDNVTLTAGAKTLGQLYLNQPLASTVNFEVDDVLALMNIDGDGGANYGYWQELYRKLSIR